MRSGRAIIAATLALGAGLAAGLAAEPGRADEVQRLLDEARAACADFEDGTFEAGDAVSTVEGVRNVTVELTWEPQWGMDMMSDEARLELGFM